MDHNSKNNSQTGWIPNDPEQAEFARHVLEIWPLDTSNAQLLNEVHPYGYIQSTTEIHVCYCCHSPYNQIMI